MPSFLEREKQRLIPFVQTSPYFSAAARGGGSYKGHDYAFCLPAELAEENLFFEIRQPAMEFFAQHNIQWHDGHDGKPSNHLCSSQVCCVNFFYPFAHQPQALATLLRPVFPTLGEMLPVEAGQFITFEWIGKEDYLNEQVHPNQIRTRGANFTSADAAVKFRHMDGRIHFVLIEWKYTEAYSTAAKWEGKSGQTRLRRYKPIYAADDCPLDKERIEGLKLGFEALFYEPFYQFMRQQFLAHGMEKAGEEKANLVSVLHLAPRSNHNFKKVTSPALQVLGDEATAVWKRLVATPGRFASVSIEDLFSNFEAKNFPKLKNWREYVTARYTWVDKKQAAQG